MKTTIYKLALALLTMASLCAHAQRPSLEQIGLVHLGQLPETRYKEVREPGEDCRQGKDLLVTSERFANTVVPKYVTNCDSTPIGWVSLTFNAAWLVPNNVDQNTFVLYTSYSRGQNGQVELGDSINIYTCDYTRNDELMKRSLPAGYTGNAKENFATLKNAARRALRVRVDLFFNEYISSGKCIGGIQVLN